MSRASVGQLLERGEQRAPAVGVEDGFLGRGGRLARGDRAAARTASCVAAPGRAARLRASFATICSSHGRNGSPARNRPSARHALTSPSWAASSASAALRVMR